MPNCWNMTELKIRLIKDIVSGKRTIKEVGEILDTSRQSISKWKWKYIQEWESWLIPKKAWPKQWNSPPNKTEEWLESEICRLARENYFKWPVWISEEIEDIYDLSINQSTVYRILKRNNIRYYSGYYHTKKKRKLYVKDIPGRELQVDVSFPYGYQRKLCVYTAIDDASRYVYSKIYSNHEEINSIDFLKRLQDRTPYTIQAIRTDQWREFSRKFTQYITENMKAEHNKNPPYTPQHNGKVERYHRTMKENCCIYWKFDASIEELQYNLTLWTVHYNSTKRHHWLWMKWKTPQQKLKIFKQQNPLSLPLM